MKLYGQPFGFVESSTRHQKTGTSVLKKAMQMPPVCPVLGVSDVEWAHIWMETVMSMGLDLFQTRSDQTLSARSVTSEEIGLAGTSVKDGDDDSEAPLLSVFEEHVGTLPDELFEADNGSAPEPAEDEGRKGWR